MVEVLLKGKKNMSWGFCSTEKPVLTPEDRQWALSVQTKKLLRPKRPPLALFKHLWDPNRWTSRGYNLIIAAMWHNGLQRKCKCIPLIGVHRSVPNLDLKMTHNQTEIHRIWSKSLAHTQSLQMELTGISSYWLHANLRHNIKVQHGSRVQWDTRKHHHVTPL